MERAELATLLGHRGGPTGTVQAVVVAESHPGKFREAFARAVAGRGPVFLADPRWGDRERRQFDALVVQSAVDGVERGWLAIPTGGSSGQIKLARHDEQTLAAAVAGFRAHFGFAEINAVGVLPLHHVSGLMAWLRGALSGGHYLPADWKRLAEGQLPAIDKTRQWTLSLVPTQLASLLPSEEAVAWLRGFQAVLVGGGSAWAPLLEIAREREIPLAPSYGSTETAAMVAALRPSEFLSGAEGSGPVMPHAKVTIESDALITVRSEALYRGYWPNGCEEAYWCGGDLGRWGNAGSLIITGRADRLITSGGEKVNPMEIEVLLRGLPGGESAVVLGVPDDRWGERVVVCVPPGSRLGLIRVHQALEGSVAAFKWPKTLHVVDPWPSSEAGKVNHGALRHSVIQGGA